MTEFDMYWITRLDSFGVLFAAVAIMSGIALAVALIITLVSWADCMADDCCSKRGLRAAKWAAVVLFADLFVGSFVPSTKEYCAIKVIPALVNNGKVGETLECMRDLALEWMKDQVEESKYQRAKK